MASTEVTRPAAPGKGTKDGKRSWQGRTFGPASEEPYRRRSSDWVRVVAATALLVALARHAGHAGDAERGLFQFFNSLPDELHSVLRALYGVGALWAVGLVVAAAAVGRRWRLARDLFLSGALAWAGGRLLGTLVDQGDLAESLDAVVRLSRDTPTFPLVHLALIVAVVSTAAPYLTRPTRRVGHTVVTLVALSAMYLGVGSPNDVLGGLALGWAVAAAVHLVFGSPGGRPTSAQVEAGLAEMGVRARDVRLAGSQPADATLMIGQDDEGPLWLKVLGRDDANAQFVSKLWRFVVFKDSGPALFVSRLQRVEHEAYSVLRARDAGVRVPTVVTAASAGPGSALLVERPVAGPRLDELAREAVTDELLDRLWGEVRRLHEGHLAHGALNASHVVAAREGPAIVDFRSATVSATPDRRPNDVAELLASTATIVGPDRAVAAAVRGLGPEAVESALPFLQPPALSRETRAPGGEKRKERRAHLQKLLDVGAAAVGTDPPSLEQLHRVKGSSLLMSVGLFVAIGALLSQVGSPAAMWDTIKHAEWGWVAVAFALSMSTNVAFAFALMGTVPIRLPLLAASELQLSMSFSNLAVPGIGGAAEQVRFLQKQGADLASAVAAGGILASVAGTVVQLGLFAVALLLTPDTFSFPNVPTNGLVPLVLGAVLVVGVLAGVVFGVPRLRRAVLPHLEQAMSTVWAALRSPRQLGLLIAGNAAATLVYGVCLEACLLAFGGSLNFWTLIVIKVGIGTVASLIPIPGGSTAISSVGISGALAAFGVPKEVAVSAVLTYQIVVNYLPAVIGWFATSDLIRRDYL